MGREKELTSTRLHRETRCMIVHVVKFETAKMRRSALERIKRGLRILSADCESFKREQGMESWTTPSHKCPTAIGKKGAVGHMMHTMH